MTARPTAAARQMMTEISQVIPDAEFDHTAADGLNRYRALVLDRQTSHDIGDLLEAIEDERLLAVSTTDGRTRVAFVPDSRADWGHPYGIPEAYEVLASVTDDDDDTDDTAEDEQPDQS
jgi:hypothetical protein